LDFGFVACLEFSAWDLVLRHYLGQLGIRSIRSIINMFALLFSDSHASIGALNLLRKILTEKKKEIALLIFSGDLVNMGEPVEYAEQFIELIKLFKIPLFWVPGNNDFGESYKVLQNHTLSLEGKIVEFAGHRFTGVGGSPASWSGQYQGENSVNRKDIAGTIFVSHMPPHGLSKLNATSTENFHRKDTENVIASGAKQSDNLTIKQLSNCPLAHICGHVHHTWGIGYIGQTKVIKLASFEFGFYAIMNLENLEVSFMSL